MIKTEVLKQMPARFDMCGRFMGYPLREKDESISQGLASRLMRYATTRAMNSGLMPLVESWPVLVSTIDDGGKKSDRCYSVQWKNPQGLSISLNGIMLRNGWPFIDHRFSLDE